MDFIDMGIDSILFVVGMIGLFLLVDAVAKIIFGGGDHE